MSNVLLCQPLPECWVQKPELLTGTLISYIAACMAVIIAPGPAQVLVFAVTMSEGRKAGIVTVLGLNSSMIVHILAAAIGISAILAASAEAFTIVKFLGAAYLIYIGIQALLPKSSVQSDTEVQNKNTNHSGIFSKAFLTGMLNPKVALFFLAFVPQFVDPGKGYMVIQFLILGLILAGIDIVYESALTILIGKLRNRYINNKLFTIIRQKISGFVMIGLGIRMVFLKQV